MSQAGPVAAAAAAAACCNLPPAATLRFPGCPEPLYICLLALTPASSRTWAGVVLWELCTGEQPERGRMRAIHVPEEAPAEVTALVARCLAVDPSARPSALELMQALQALVSGSKRSLKLRRASEKCGHGRNMASQAGDGSGSSGSSSSDGSGRVPEPDANSSSQPGPPTPMPAGVICSSSTAVAPASCSGDDSKHEQQPPRASVRSVQISGYRGAPSPFA